MTLVVRVAAMAALWVALWGEASPANLVWGIVLAVVLSLAFPVDPRGRVRVRPGGFARYVGHMIVSLVGSSWAVVRAVVSPTPERTETSVLTVPLSTGSPLVATVVANSITLTPGTMTLACDPGTLALTVHVLGRVDEARFAAQIAELERIVSRALVVPELAG